MLSWKKGLTCLTLALILTGCRTSAQAFLAGLANLETFGTTTEVEAAPIKGGRSVIVCRSKQCAPARLSMSTEYIYNSVFHLFENNNNQKALVCEADPASHTCTENFITIPITVGITPAHMYIDSVKISDTSVGKGDTTLQLLLNYNITYNGQTPDCLPSMSMFYVKNTSNIILEDSGYSCKMTSIGQTTIKTVFAIDYIDLDYGFIGGYYSIGASGPAYGGGTGYMLLRLPNDAYPLAPHLQNPKETKQNKISQAIGDSFAKEEPRTKRTRSNTGVEIFPIKK